MLVITIADTHRVVYMYTYTTEQTIQLVHDVYSDTLAGIVVTSSDTSLVTIVLTISLAAMEGRLNHHLSEMRLVHV